MSTYGDGRAANADGDVDTRDNDAEEAQEETGDGVARGAHAVAARDISSKRWSGDRKERGDGNDGGGELHCELLMW